MDSKIYIELEVLKLSNDLKDIDHKLLILALSVSYCRSNLKRLLESKDFQFMIRPGNFPELFEEVDF